MNLPRSIAQSYAKLFNFVDYLETDKLCASCIQSM